MAETRNTETKRYMVVKCWKDHRQQYQVIDMVSRESVATLESEHSARALAKGLLRS
jgi:hypothetical protein